MYKRIIVPVNLEHTEQLEKALATGADLAKLYKADLYLVSITSGAPGAVAHNPQEFAQKLDAFAKEQTNLRGIKFNSKAVMSPDPVADADDALKATAEKIDADLVVMASHVPGLREYFYASRAGYLASHATISVFVVR